MNAVMTWYDWLFVVVPVLIVVLAALKSQKYVRSVSDFLTAGRVAGRYVIAVASGEAGMGLISLVALFEMYYNSGFAYSFWNGINIPIGIYMSLTGYCIYRFRETRAMTMGQFLEMRYNRGFRIFAAVLQCFSGIVNYAIFPAVSARCLIYYCDLPLHVTLLGMEFSTFALMMAALLSLALFITMAGGQITIMVTDCVQGILSYPMYTVIVVYLLYRFSWSHEIAPALLDRPAGSSMLNPYEIQNLRDFNLFYVVAGIVGSVLGRMSWGGSSGYNAAAATPHEQKMGGVLGTWRAGFSSMMYILLAVCAYTYLHHADFRSGAKKVHHQLTAKVLDDVLPGEEFNAFRKEMRFFSETGQLSAEFAGRLSGGALAPAIAGSPEAVKNIAHSVLKTENPAKGQTFHTLYMQTLVPVSLREIFPPVLTGIFCALMFFLCISTDTTYLHSWGTIFVQDVILPFRKKPFTPHEQLRLLRILIFCVAAFAFTFSYYFSQLDFILMFFTITGVIWNAGAGPCIVFGLYWKKGTTAGAFGAMIAGAVLGCGGFIGQKIWATHLYPFLDAHHWTGALGAFLDTITKPFQPYILWQVTPDKFPMNSTEISFLATITALTLYITLSLLTCKRVFNMDRLLHRGIYRVESEELKDAPGMHGIRGVFRRFLGIDSHYTTADKAIAWSVFGWSVVWNFGSFLFIVIWNVFSPWSNEGWGRWFLLQNVIVAGLVGLVSTVWFMYGGIRDLILLFRNLENAKENAADDGMVIGHVSRADADLLEAREKNSGIPSEKN